MDGSPECRAESEAERRLHQDLRREEAMGRIRERILGLDNVPALTAHLQSEWIEELRRLGLPVLSMSLQRPGDREGFYWSDPGTQAGGQREAPLSDCPWVAEAWRSGRAVVVGRDRLIACRFGVPEVHTLAEVPLLGSACSLGVSSAVPDAFGEEAVRTLEGFAALVALALHRAKDWEALRKSETRYRTIIAMARDGFCLTDAQGRLLEVNEAYCRMSGYRVDELLSLSIPDIEASENSAGVTAHLERVISRGEDRFESRHRRKDGSVYDVEVTVQYLPVDGGQLASFILDTTEQKHVAEALRVETSLERVRSAVLGMEQEQDWPLILELVDRELRQLVDYESSCLNFIDLQTDQYRGYHLHQPWEEQETIEGIPPALRQVIDTRAPVYRRNRQEIERLDAPGYPPQRQSALDVPFSGGTLSISSDREGAFEEGVIRTVAQFGHALSEAYGRWHVRREQRRAATALQVEGALQRLRNTILQMDTEADWQEVVIVCERELRSLVEFRDCSIGIAALQGQGMRFYRAGKGAVFPPLDVPGVHPALQQAMATGKPVYRPSRRDPLFEPDFPKAIHSVIDVPFTGGTLAVSSTREDAFSPADIDVLSRFAQVIPEACRRLMDITERRRLEREMIRLQRLSAAAELSAGVSHNLNNILTGVLLPAQALRARVDDPTWREELDIIVLSAERAAGLVRRLHQSVRNSDEDLLQSVMVDKVVRQVVQATRSRWRDASEARGERIEICLDLGETPLIRGTESGLHDLLTNLVLNAVDAMPGGGTVTIRTAEEDGAVRLTFSDTGIGMDEQTRVRIFEPFFTTKLNVGTGLGLSTLHNTVAQWGGRVEVESAPGQGATFTLWLPIWAAAGTEETSNAGPGADRAGRILVAEDDEIVCRVLTSALGDRHRLDVGLDARQVLARLAPGRYDVAIIDLGLPGLSGEELAQRIEKVDPAVARILFTGWELAEQDSRRDAFDLYLQKPLTDLQVLFEVIDRGIELHDRRAAGDGPDDASRLTDRLG